MITMLNHPVETIVDFIIERFPVGSLTYKNLFSFYRFLSSIGQINTPKAEALCAIMQDLFRQGFFEMHLTSFSTQQVSSFNERVAISRTSTEKYSFLPLVAGQVSSLQHNEDIEIRLSQ